MRCICLRVTCFVLRFIISSQVVAHLRGHAGTAVWRHCLRQKKGDLRRQEKFFKCIIIHEGATNLCILFVLIMYLNNVLSCCRAALHIIICIMEKIKVGPDSRYVPYFMGSALCSLVPMFPGTYVPRCLCSTVPMFPGTDVPRFLYFNSRL